MTHTSYCARCKTHYQSECDFQYCPECGEITWVVHDVFMTDDDVII